MTFVFGRGLPAQRRQSKSRSRTSTVATASRTPGFPRLCGVRVAGEAQRNNESEHEIPVLVSGFASAAPASRQLNARLTPVLARMYRDQSASCEATLSMSASPSAADRLGLPGFSFADLHEPARLADLHARFAAAVAE
ncbi:MAG: hypothetical protein R2712_00365, partial [Vicinamibacterales bacterium]